MKYTKVKDEPELIRDMESKAVLNNSPASLFSYKKKREKHREIDQSIADINTMKQEMNELKMLLNRIIDKIG
jgi:hypothetical protein